jgi:adenylosuccinate synthase
MLLAEVNELKARGVPVGANLVLSDRAQVVMPWHKLLDNAREKSDGSKAHGTTGKGIGPCYADKVSYRGIRVGDLYDDEWFRERLRVNLAEKNAILTKVYGEKALDFDAVHAAYRGYAKALEPFVGDAVTLLHDAIAAGKYVLFEGAQGVMLDVDLGNYPYVTGSNSCALGVPSGTGIPPRALNHVIGVTKAYATRVGAGPFPTEDHGKDGERLREIGREFGTTTGRPRRCGWLDAVALRYSVRSNGIDGLAVVKLDVLRGFEKLKMCVAYDTPHGRIETVPATAPGLFAAKPVWREYPGFTEDISGVRTMAGLPANARRFVEAIAAEVGAPLSLVSVGASREQVIVMDAAA